MMNSKISLTSSVTPEIKTQGCASVHKGWKLFGSAPAPDHRSFPALTAQDGALSLSFNQPIISKFRNNPVRRAAWGRERNLLCGRSLLSARSLKQIGAGRPLRRRRWRRRGAPGGYRTCRGSEQSLPPGKVLPSPGLSPPCTSTSSGFKLQPLWRARAPSAARPLPAPPHPSLSFNPGFSPLPSSRGLRPAPLPSTGLD